MDDEPIRYIKPHFFDWGMYKAHGELILLITTGCYVACFVLCILLIQRTAQRVGYPNLGMVLGCLALVPMVYMAMQSILVQLTSAHYQEAVHIPAVITVAVSFAAVVGAWGVVAWRWKHTGPSSG